MVRRVWCGAALCLSLMGVSGGGLSAAHAQTGDNLANDGGGVRVIHPLDNGFGDLIAAGQALRQKPASGNSGKSAATPDVLGSAQSAGATLAQKRAAMRDPRVQTAMSLLRSALTKPQITPPSETDLYLQFVNLRQIARVLALVEYVQLADGNTASALDTMDEAVSLGDAVQRWSLTSSTVGQAMIAADLQPVVTNLRRLSTGDCNRLQALLAGELNAPNPAAVGIQSDTSAAMAMLTEAMDGILRPRDAESSPNGAGDGEHNEDGGLTLSEADKQTIRMLRDGQGAVWHDFLGKVSQQIEQQNDRMAAQLAAYPQDAQDAADTTAPQSTPPSPAPSASNLDRLAGAMARLVVLNPQASAATLDEFATSRAKLQLLAVHAAIHRYRWEHNALPQSLKDLEKPGAVIVDKLLADPFLTATPLHYERTSTEGVGYILSCAGPMERNDLGKPIPGSKRKPLTLLTTLP